MPEALTSSPKTEGAEAGRNINKTEFALELQPLVKNVGQEKWTFLLPTVSQ